MVFYLKITLNFFNMLILIYFYILTNGLHLSLASVIISKLKFINRKSCRLYLESLLKANFKRLSLV